MFSKIKTIFLPLAIFIISLIVIYFVVPKYHPDGAIRLMVDEKEILQKGKSFLNELGIPFKENQITARFERDKNVHMWIRENNSISRSNEILEKMNWAYFWKLSYNVDNDTSLTVRSTPSQTIIEQASNTEFYFNQNGKVISFSRKIAEDKVSESFSADSAIIICQNFIKIFRNDIEFVSDTTNKFLTAYKFSLDKIETNSKAGRTDYLIKWIGKNEIGYSTELRANLIGNEIREFQLREIVPEAYQKTSTNIYEVISTILMVLLIAGLIVFIGFRRFRAYEIGFRMAIVFGIVIFLSHLIKQLIEQFSQAGIELILGLSLSGIFLFGIAVILWAVSETFFREVWNEKFRSLDLIFHKHFSHQLVGNSILYGISFGFGITVLFILIFMATDQFINLSFIGETITGPEPFVSSIPGLSILFGVFNAYGLLAVSFFMLLAAGIKRYVTDNSFYIIVTGLIWGILVFSNIEPVIYGVLLNLVLGLILTIILVRFDLFTTFLTYFSYLFFLKATGLIFINNDGIFSNWNIILIITILVLLISIYFIIKKQKTVDLENISPKFVENITERQRLKKELEVARIVQMSFLPKSNPEFEGLDIASTCIPAFEVGGDYYDFIKLDDKKLGIIIGDVSGKGTQAAFYMTLAKGFIKAIAKTSNSPSKVLAKMNELFYENVERGRFISMIYAIVDTEHNIIKIARAGHNPVIMKESEDKINLISPKGLALGLEKGQLFEQIITEVEEKLEKGKSFIFYTDGFTEAIDKKGDEYGLDRLSEIADKNFYKSADEIIQNLVTDVTSFIGKAKQHDDMTIVVVKVK